MIAKNSVITIFEFTLLTFKEIYYKIVNLFLAIIRLMIIIVDNIIWAIV
jgi:hypothetical protein